MNNMNIVAETQRWEAILASEGLAPIGETIPFEEDMDFRFMEKVDRLLQMREDLADIAAKLEEEEYNFLKGFVSTETGMNIFLENVKKSI